MPIEIRNPGSSGSVSGLTPGAVLFGASDGTIGEDAAHLFWNDTLDLLSVGSDDGSITVAAGSETMITSVHQDGDKEFMLGLLQHTADPEFGAHMIFARSRGTEASESVVSADDELMEIGALGFDGTDYAFAALIRCEVDGSPGSNDMPGRLVFLTTPDASQTPVERLRIAQSGFTTIGTGGTFTLAAGAGDLGINGELEVNGQTRFDDVMSFQTAPSSNTMFNAVFTSATIINAINLDMVAQPTTGIAATSMNFVFKDEAASSTALVSVIGIASDVRYNRNVANIPSSYALHAMRVTNYGVQSGATINAGTWTWHGLSINAANAGANVSAGTHILYDILTDTEPTGFPGGTRHYSIKMQDDAWIIDSAPLWFGTGEDCKIEYTGTNWSFDVAVATTEIVFNETGTDTDFRIEIDTNQNALFIDSTNSRMGVMTGTTFTTLTVEGGIGGNVRTITGTSNTLTGADWLVIMDSSGGNCSCLLPRASNKGQMITIKRLSASNTCTITCNAADNIQADADDSVTLTATAYLGRTYIADGNLTWYRIDAQSVP